MGFGSIWHWLLVILVLVLLFGSGKISGLMGDLAKGIKSFKKEMSEDGAEPEAEPEPEPEPEPKVIEHRTEKPAAAKPRTARAKAPRAATKSKSS
jgi:sec-independent protein translocase protein TatA